MSIHRNLDRIEQGIVILTDRSRRLSELEQAAKSLVEAAKTGTYAYKDYSILMSAISEVEDLIEN